MPTRWRGTSANAVVITLDTKASWWQRVRKIAHLPGTKLTPEVVLARTLEKAQAGRIKSVVVVVEWMDGGEDDQNFAVDWSNMPVGTMLCHAALLDAKAKNVFMPKEE